jgi:UDP-N-acetylglucosamine 2-epimerase (non-hydrolysing)
MKKKIAIIVGTRPEVIKMAPIYFAMREHRKLQPILISTGQHREMLDQACKSFGIKPDIDLNLMLPKQSLDELSAKIISACGALFRQIKPSAVLVQGDTTSVLGAAMAAFYEKTPIGHVEAGLRTYDFAAPWPEEMNRRLVDPLCKWCFAPTLECANNLKSERVPAENIFVTGNTVIDSLIWTKNKIEERGFGIDYPLIGIQSEFAERFLTEKRSGSDRLILVTGHRRESFGEGFENICTAIRNLVDRYSDVGVIYPVHLNPSVQEPVNRILGSDARIQLIPPADYKTFVWLMNKSYFILSDSGGIQEEAPSLGKPVLVMRHTTERPEGVTAGTTMLVGTDPDNILNECSRLLENENEYKSRAKLKNPYGDGRTGVKIVSILDKSFSNEN